MQSNPHKLTVIDGETLMDKRLPPTKFCVDTLLPQGLCILGGSPKVGKSWLVLDLCVHVAQGSPLWGLDVTRGEVLYLCLEDSERRIQERLNTITDNVPEGLYFATGCTSIESGVCDWLRDFKRQHPDDAFIASFAFVLRPPKRRSQRRRAMPIPLRRRRNFFCLQKKYHGGVCTVISRCRKATFHIPLAEYFTLTERISLYE